MKSQYFQVFKCNAFKIDYIYQVKVISGRQLIKPDLVYQKFTLTAN